MTTEAPKFWMRVWRAGWLPAAVGVAVIAVVLVGDDALQKHTAGAAGRLPDDGKLYVRIFDIGQGDAILIRTPSGDDILIDGGPDDRIVEKLGDALPPNDRDIELMVVTHPHADHMVGLVEVLRRYEVRRIWTSGAANNTASFRALENAIQAEGAAVEVARTGTRLMFGSTTIDVVYPSEGTTLPDDPNDQSVVFMLTDGAVRLLFTGDATERVEKELLARASSTLRAVFLKVAHHGSRYSTSREFLEAVSPALAAISVGEKNTYGHPSYRTLRRLREAGVAVYRTDESGDLSFTVDGTSVILSGATRNY